MNVLIFGSGKVGRALARATRASGGAVTLRAARKGLPKKAIDADLLILAVRDRELHPLAEALAEQKLVTKKTACVHVSGATNAEVLAPLRAVSAGVAQMHPMISFASRTSFPSLLRGHVHVKGDPIAEKRARAFARKLGMTPRTFESLDTIGYHAAAGLVANGAAALAAIGAKLLVASGVPEDDAARMLGPLLRSVADNVESLGFPDALTGPVRRGEVAGLERHYEVLRARVPEALPLYLASARAQLPLARALGDAPPQSFVAIANFLDRADAESAKPH